MFDHTSITLKDRVLRLEILRQRQHVPVLIVGGGINGISTFRELALQGIPAVMVEQGDWCQAASGALSRMIHGGLRYLETGEFSLVKESVEERDRLLQNAPHYVAPLKTTVPIDSWGGGLIGAAKRFMRLSEKPARRGALIIKTGLSLYDIYTRKYGSMPKHQLHGRAATRQRWPDFADWVKCSATYYDAWISAPERLGYELIEDSEKANALALALNYVCVVACNGDNVTLRDNLSGEFFTLQPNIVVNATGAWIDQLNGVLTPDDAAAKLIGGTKGSHLIIDHPALLAELDGGMVYYENQEGRICIMFPWYGKVLVGSTDIRVDSPENIVCEAEEQRYILESLRFVFPHFDIKDSDVVYTFSGVRPLPASHAASNGQISRNHSLVLIPPAAERHFSTLCLVGGKWTTFRKFGEQAADRVLHLLGERRKVSSENLAIGGGRHYPTPDEKANWIHLIAEDNGLSLDRAQQLVARYGSRAIAIIHSFNKRPEAFLKHHPGYSQQELRFLIQHEQVAQLEDVLVRRTSLAISGQLTVPLVEEILQLLAGVQVWNEDTARQHLALTLSHLASQHGLTELAAPSDLRRETHVELQ